MGKCPKCDGDSGFFLNSQVSGWEERHIKWDGQIDWTNLDKLRYTKSRTGICQDCGKRINIEDIKLY